MEVSSPARGSLRGGPSPNVVIWRFRRLASRGTSRRDGGVGGARSVGARAACVGAECANSRETRASPPDVSAPERPRPAYDSSRWQRVGLYAGFCPGGFPPWVAIPLGRRLLDGSSGLPGFSGRAALTLLGLAPGGVCRATRVTPGAGALLPHPFTLACARRTGPSAVCSLLHCPAGRPDWVLPSTVPCGVRTFLGPIPCHDQGRVAARYAATRPTRCRLQPRGIAVRTEFPDGRGRDRANLEAWLR